MSSIFRKPIRQIKNLVRRLDLDDIPPASLLFLGGCLILALITILIGLIGAAVIYFIQS